MGAAPFSDEWLAECNAALATLPAPARPLAVTERLTDPPEGSFGAITLVADDDGVRLVAGADEAAGTSITISATDAAALHAGTLSPAEAITQGKVRVRGDLRAVVEATALLAAAHAALRDRP